MIKLRQLIRSNFLSETNKMFKENKYLQIEDTKTAYKYKFGKYRI